MKRKATKGKTMAKKRGGKHVGAAGGVVGLDFVQALDDGSGHISWDAGITNPSGYTAFWTRGYLRINPSGTWVKDLEIQSNGFSGDSGSTPWTTGVTTGQARVDVRDDNGELLATSGIFDVTT